VHTTHLPLPLSFPFFHHSLFYAAHVLGTVKPLRIAAARCARCTRDTTPPARHRLCYRLFHPSTARSGSGSTLFSTSIPAHNAHLRARAFGVTIPRLVTCRACAAAGCSTISVATLALPTFFHMPLTGLAPAAGGTPLALTSLPPPLTSTPTVAVARLLRACCATICFCCKHLLITPLLVGHPTPILTSHCARASSTLQIPLSHLLPPHHFHLSPTTGILRSCLLPTCHLSTFSRISPIPNTGRYRVPRALATCFPIPKPRSVTQHVSSWCMAASLTPVSPNLPARRRPAAREQRAARRTPIPAENTYAALDTAPCLALRVHCTGHFPPCISVVEHVLATPCSSFRRGTYCAATGSLTTPLP